MGKQKEYLGEKQYCFAKIQNMDCRAVAGKSIYVTWSPLIWDTETS